MANLLRRLFLSTFITDEPDLQRWLAKHPNSELFALIDEGIIQ